MSFSDKELPYKVINLPLDTARGDVVGKVDYSTYVPLTKISNTMTIITLDGGSLKFKLNSDDNDSITASDGLKIEGTVITELYWGNTAQPALTAEIYLAWVN